jgi:hypothetical protein
MKMLRRIAAWRSVVLSLHGRIIRTAEVDDLQSVFKQQNITLKLN